MIESLLSNRCCLPCDDLMMIILHCLLSEMCCSSKFRISAWLMFDRAALFTSASQTARFLFTTSADITRCAPSRITSLSKGPSDNKKACCKSHYTSCGQTPHRSACQTNVVMVQCGHLLLTCSKNISYLLAFYRAENMLFSPLHGSRSIEMLRMEPF